MKTLALSVILVLSPFAFAGGGSSIGPGNPASVNCLKLGGQYEAVITPQGEAGNCVIEEWTLFRAMAERGLVKTHQHSGSQVGMANPASVNCEDIQGSGRIVETAEGQLGFCVVDEWQLFRVINVL